MTSDSKNRIRLHAARAATPDFVSKMGALTHDLLLAIDASYEPGAVTMETRNLNMKVDLNAQNNVGNAHCTRFLLSASRLQEPGSEVDDVDMRFFSVLGRHSDVLGECPISIIDSQTGRQVARFDAHYGCWVEQKNASALFVDAPPRRFSMSGIEQVIGRVLSVGKQKPNGKDRVSFCEALDLDEQLFSSDVMSAVIPVPEYRRCVDMLKQRADKDTSGLCILMVLGDWTLENNRRKVKGGELVSIEPLPKARKPGELLSELRGLLEMPEGITMCDVDEQIRFLRGRP